MKVRKRAKLLKQRQSPRLTKHEREFLREAVELHAYLNRDTLESRTERDAAQARYFAMSPRFTVAGSLEAIRARLKTTEFDKDYARLQSPEYAKLAREAERTLPPPRFRKFGKPRDEG